MTDHNATTKIELQCWRDHGQRRGNQVVWALTCDDEDGNEVTEEYQTFCGALSRILDLFDETVRLAYAATEPVALP